MRKNSPAHHPEIADQKHPLPGCWFFVKGCLIFVTVIGIFYLSLAFYVVPPLFAITTTPRPTPSQEQVAFARQLVFEGPCQPPCWYGLELDQSSKADVLATLQSLPFFASDTVRETEFDYYYYDSPAIRLSPECIEGMEPCVEFDLANDRLVGIMIWIGETLFLEEVIEQYGPPDYSRALLNQYTVDYDCEIVLSWEARQIKVYRGEPNGRELCESLKNEIRLSRKLGIDGIRYVSPREFETEARNTQPWLGFNEP